MLIDMHVHTTRYSKFSRMSAESMAERARTVGLDGLVITEHDVFGPTTRSLRVTHGIRISPFCGVSK